MFVRKKKNKSGSISVQIIDKSNGKYRVIKTIGVAKTTAELNDLLLQAKREMHKIKGNLSLDFTDYVAIYHNVLSNIISHRLVGIEKVIGKIYDEIGFNEIKDDLLKDLVMYRVVYPRSKLKTTEYLQRYAGKIYTEDDIYRYMDKLHSTLKDKIQEISYKHTTSLFAGRIRIMFYDVTTLYFEIDKEDELRKRGYSKDGKNEQPQIVLGLLVSREGYPVAYEIFEGNKYEGHTLIEVLDKFKKRYKIERIVVVADAGMLNKKNIEGLKKWGYEFIIGGRIKNEKEEIKKEILKEKWEEGKIKIIEYGDATRLVVHYSMARAEKDQYNRERGIERMSRQIKEGRLRAEHIQQRGYKKYIKITGEAKIEIDKEKIEADKRWDGLKGYYTNSKMGGEEIIKEYNELWQIERAFRIAKSELKIRPIYHYRRRRIEAHICLNFMGYKVYKELERQIKIKGSLMSVEKVIEVIQSIYEITLLLPNGERINHTLLLSEEQKIVQKLFDF